MKEIKATAKNVRGSARKARLVTDAIKGMNALYAMDVLTYMPKGAAVKVKKVLGSAIANAVHNENLKPETLQITKVFVDDAPMLKRMHPQSRGRGRRILKRNSHITIFLGTPEVATKAKTKTASAEETKAEVKEEKTVETKPKTVKAKTTKQTKK